MAVKGNRNQEKAKLRSSNMGALMTIDKKLRTECETSPEVNKRNLKAMANAEKAEAVAKNLLNVAGVIDSEIGNLDKKCLKNATAVDLDDVRAVMERSRDYFIACATAKNPPSMLTYCSIGLGLTQNRVNDYIRKHNNASVDFILRVKDLIADQITTGAMYGNLDNIMAIFQLKNLHGFADNVRVEAAVAEQAPEINEDDLRKEYEKYAKENGIQL
jgi:hypothetical protein